MIGIYSAIKDFKSNVSIEVTSEKLTLYKIFKSDLFKILDSNSDNEKAVLDSLRFIDTIQQLAFDEKIDYIEKNEDLLKNLNLFKSLLDTKKPLFVDESLIVNSLKNQETSVTTTNKNLMVNKLTNVKQVEVKSKISGTKLGNSDNQNNEVKNTLKTLKRLESIVDEPSKMNEKEILKNETDKLANVKKVVDLKSGLSVNQINSQNKLNALIGIKKQSINQEEMNSAFAKINARKIGTAINNKISESINFSSKISDTNTTNNDENNDK